MAVVTLKNGEGYVFALADFWVVDSSGTPRKEGQYIYIKDIWIHKKYRGKKVIEELIPLIDKHKYCGNVIGVYWRNDKFGRLTKVFSRKRLAKKGVKECSLHGYYP